MLPLSAKITIAILVAVCSIIGHVSGMAGWYRDCLGVTKGKGYQIVFLPLVVAVLALVVMGLTGLWGFSDEISMLSGLLSSAILIYTAYKQIRGECSPSCPVGTGSSE